METIEISDPCYQRLVKRIHVFGESPEDVIQRLLDETESGDQRPRREVIAETIRRNRPPVSPGELLPQRAYWRPILSIIAERGGAVPAGDVIAALGDRLKDSFTPLDLGRLNTGAIRWRNRARFARLRMTEQGLLDDGSPRGIWAITDAGRDFLKSAE